MKTNNFLIDSLQCNAKFYGWTAEVWENDLSFKVSIKGKEDGVYRNIQGEVRAIDLGDACKQALDWMEEQAITLNMEYRV